MGNANVWVEFQKWGKSVKDGTCPIYYIVYWKGKRVRFFSKCRLTAEE